MGAKLFWHAVQKRFLLEFVVIFPVPVGVNQEREIGLGEHTVAFLEERAGVRRDAVASDGYSVEHTATDDGAIAVKTRARHLDVARCSHIRKRKRLVNLYAVGSSFLRLRRLGDTFQRRGVEVGRTARVLHQKV